MAVREGIEFGGGSAPAACGGSPGSIFDQKEASPWAAAGICSACGDTIACRRFVHKFRNKPLSCKSLFTVGLGLFFAAIQPDKVSASEGQTNLARRIKHASVTAPEADAGGGLGRGLYTPLLPIRDMKVDGCSITARSYYAESAARQDRTVLEITFDLSRTVIPELDGSPVEFWKPDGRKNGGAASFELRFLPPYKPVLRTAVYGAVPEQQVGSLRLLMEPLPDDTQPRQLLALLKAYQSQYCTFAG